MHYKKAEQPPAIRRLSALDRQQIKDHFLRLDEQSRRARFCGSVSDERIIEYVDKIFQQGSILCGTFFDGKLRGVVELRGDFHRWQSTAEVAFSVETDWQNRGIGDALFDRIFAIGQNRFVKTIVMMCLKENTRMRHLAAKHGARLEYDHDTVEAAMQVPRLTAFSTSTEIIGEARGRAKAWLDRGARPLWPNKLGGLRDLRP